MAKNKKRKQSKQTQKDKQENGENPNKKKKSKPQKPSIKKFENQLHKTQSEFLASLPSKVRENFFSNKHTDPDTRAEIWSQQADIGEEAVNQYAWATPDEKCTKILKHFSKCGIVEVGCGANAYWSRMMFSNGIDVKAYDVSLGQGGQITLGEKKGQSKLQKKESVAVKKFDDGFQIACGGPEVLKEKRNHKRTLFLCYPDEDLMEDEDGNVMESMGASCLEHFEGDTVIHVGELYGDTPSMDQAPWGRSSGAEFQQRLSSEYHCILRVRLQNWLHVNDTISVWKRTELCTIVFQGEDDDESDDEVCYRHIPKDQMLPTDIAAPCAKHLL